MRIDLDIKLKYHDWPKEEALSHITRKWGVNGRVRVLEDMRRARVEIECWDGGQVMRPATMGHEEGHVEFFEDRLENEPNLTSQDFVDGDVWQMEVDAWLRSLPSPFTLTEGMFALDCLWTYKVGYKVSEEDWQSAKEALAEDCIEKQALLDYVPEPVPEDQEPPQPSFEFVGEDDMPGEDEPFDGEPRPVPAPKDQGTPADARERWLLGPEGIRAAKYGVTRVLERRLREAGHSAKGPLPLITAAVFKDAGGRWPW